MASSSGHRGRSSSLFSSSSPRSRSSDWFVSSPISQSQPPPPIRQRTFRRMSPARSSTGAISRPEQQQPAQKRTSSLVGFFSKILPSNRPEAGGTRRTSEWTGENDKDVDADPDEITDWNIAQEKNPAHPTFGADPEVSNHRRAWSWSPQKGDSRFVENLPRDRSRRREQAADTPDRESQQPRKSDALTKAEVHEVFKSKEETRKNRRSLKESGDWLGVQGADPYSGQYSVLTPTDTPSSDTTSTTTRSKLAGLARKKKAAKLEYEQIRLLEEQEKDKARLNKEQAKLNKIERVKEELRRQHQFAKWSQHKRHWSSAAEPNLSPIAQSIDSVALGSSETSSLLFSEMPTDSFISDGDDVPSNVLNFSRPTRPPVSMSRLSSDDTQPRGHRRRDLSTETIIHNSPDTNFEHITLTRPASQPSGAYLNAAQPDMGRAKSERHFLWRRRRGTDPGKSTTRKGLLMSMRAQNPTPNSIEQVQRDHFADLAIPDYHLHLLTPDTVESADSQSAISDDSPSTTPNPISMGTMGRNRMAMSSVTNLVLQQENDKIDQDTSAATAISSQSKLKGIMRHPSIRRKLVPSILVTPQPKDTESRQRPPSFDELQDHTAKGFPRDFPVYQSQHQPLSLLKRVDFEQTINHLPRTDSNFMRARRESVSIPTTIITGCAPGRQGQLDPLEPKLEVGLSQVDDATETSQAQTAPIIPDRQEHCAEPVMISEERRTPSPPVTPRSGSPNLVLAQETPETVITSAHPVILEKKPPTRVSTPTTPRLCRIIQQNAEAKRIDVSKVIEIPKGKDTPEKIENTKTETPKATEVKRSRAQEVLVLKPERHGASPGRTRATSIQETRPRALSDEQIDSMVEETARIAVLRSKAKEIVRSKSADRKVSWNKSRSPSPAKKQAPSSKAAETKHSLQQRRPKKKRPSEGGAGTGLPSKPSEHISKSTTQMQHKNVEEKTKKLDEAMTAMQLCKTIYTVLLELACNWWITVRPAFDQQSDLWRRRHRKQSTLKDVSTFTSAAVFCLAAVLGGWYVLRVFWYVVRRLA
ncbi:hypothetical protein F4818DRAFT_360288 [Hypoxylon cercidicola]|nr:hypothetical protein F4818DRAFT_360288 [Hypoxylon cercidicola]